MPLTIPRLDERTFDDIFREVRLRIPRYTREWTDFNESDPGITLLQLFAWLSEMLLVQFNRVPDANYKKFLKLLDLELESAQPATAHLTFTTEPAAPLVASILPRTQIGAQPGDGGDSLIFETEEGLDLIQPPLAALQIYDGTAFTDITRLNEASGSTFRPFGWVPQIGSALYLGFLPDPAAAGRPFPQRIRLRVFRALPTGASTATSANEARQPPAPPVTLEWEYKPRTDALRWQRLNLYEDESVAFTREGYIALQGPAQIATTPEGNVPQPHYWLRCRLAGGSYPQELVPEIDFLRPNTVEARNVTTVREEFIGTSEGHPDQRFTLARRPVLAGSLSLTIEPTEGEGELWIAVDDFLSSTSDDPHYTINHNAGEIRFSNGRRGRIPPAGSAIVAREYRYGGGARGNVPPAVINSLITSLTGVTAVTNERPAVGGADEQPLDQLLERAPAVLRSRNRAVTAGDFQAFAERAGGVRRSFALPLLHPDHPGVEVPGAITIVIVPDTRDVPPQASPDLIRHVCAYLDRFRLLTTELFVKGPEFVRIQVSARVAAQPYAAFGTVAEDVAAALAGSRYLDPFQQNLGEDLYPTNFYDVILGVEHVRAVESLSVFVNGRPHEPVTSRIVIPQDGLAFGVGHQIAVVPFRDR